jgi:hypothetical protein
VVERELITEFVRAMVTGALTLPQWQIATLAAVDLWSKDPAADAGYCGSCTFYSVAEVG